MAGETRGQPRGCVLGEGQGEWGTAVDTATEQHRATQYAAHFLFAGPSKVHSDSASAMAISSHSNWYFSSYMWRREVLWGGGDIMATKETREEQSSLGHLLAILVIFPGALSDQFSY